MRPFLLSVVLSALGPWVTWLPAAQQWLFIASPADPPVIYACTLDLTTGTFGPLHVAADDVRVEFIAVHPHRPILYAATNERVADPQAPTGAIRAYHIGVNDGMLTQFSQASTQDRGTTHVAINAQGTALGVCAYGGRGSCILSLNPDGTIDSELASYAHSGQSVNRARQEAPHPHGVAFDPQGDVLCVADLGNDHVEVLQRKSKTTLERASFWSAKPGAGPRHVAFHPQGKWLYCINELDNTMAVLEYDANTHTLREIQVMGTLPSEYRGENTTSEVVVHPNGRFLLGANRGHDSTVVFAIEPNTGRLQVVGHEPTQGNHPRFVGLDPTGQIYLAANLNSDNIVAFHMDAKTGALTPTGNVLQVARPMCVAFVAGH